MRAQIRARVDSQEWEALRQGSHYSRMARAKNCSLFTVSD